MIARDMTQMAARLMLIALVAALIGGCGGGAAAKNEEDFTTSGSQEADQRADQRMAKDAQLKGGNEKEQTTSSKLGGGEKTGPDGVPKADAKKTLYDRLGGEQGVIGLVEDFVTRAVADPQVNLERKGVKRGGFGIHRNESMEWQISGDNLASLKKFMVQFISLKTGGPTVYEGPEIKTITSGRHFTNAEFDAAIGDLKQSMDKLQIPNQEQKELMAIMESTRTQISEER
jgi:hemoglobin